MTIRSKTTLKTYFNTGDIPTEANFSDFIDSANMMTVDVRDYGAVGDGVSEEYPAITAAIAAVSTGGKVYFPTGTYVFRAASLVIPNFVVLEGDGWGTILKPGSALSTGIDMSGTQAGVIKNLRFNQSNATTPFCHVLLGIGAMYNKIEHCYFTASARVAGQIGISFACDNVNGSHYNIVRDNLIYVLNTGISAIAIGTQGMGANLLENNSIVECGYSIILGGASGAGANSTVMINNKLSGDVIGLWLGAAAFNNIIRECYMECDLSGGGKVLQIDAGAENNFIELIHGSSLGDTILDNGTRTQLVEFPTKGGIAGYFETVRRVIRSYNDYSFVSPAIGPVVTTPDGAHTYRLGVDNAGTITTTGVS